MHTSRRQFLTTAAMAAAATTIRAQLPTDTAHLWTSPVIDCHFHPRKDPAANVVHLNGAGIQQAYFLARVTDVPGVEQAQADNPGRFPGYSVGTDVSSPDAERIFTEAVKNGAHGFGELKFHVSALGPEMRRAYALAADLDVPVTIHFQEVPHTPTEGVFNTDVKHLDAMLKQFPRTRFVGHGDAFWANISAVYNNDRDYPAGPIVPGGLADRWLSDYPNLFGDLSANSGNNALTRDPSFTAAFLKRHADKLVFGSDCSCTDGHGAGISQNGNPGASRLTGKCVARETLTVLKANTTPELFRKIAWENGHRLYSLGA